MIAMIVLVLMLVGVVSVVGYGAMSTQVSTSQLMRAVQENRSLDQWIVAIEGNAAPVGDGGVLSLPYGEEIVLGGSAYHVPPSWILANHTNSWGRAIQYCPYAPVAVGPSTSAVTLDQENEYEVSTTTYNGRDFVTGSDPSPFEGVVGILISPLANSPQVSCADVEFSGQSYFVPGRTAMVRTISRTSIEAHTENSPMVVMLTEDNSEHHTEIINETLEQWNIRQPERLLIRFSDSETPYEFPVLSFFSSDPGSARVIQIIGQTPGGVTIDGIDSAATTLTFSGVDLQVSNIDFTNMVSVDFENGAIATNSVTFGPINIKESSWRFGGDLNVVTQSSTTTAVSIRNVSVSQGIYDITVNGSSGTTTLIDYAGGNWQSEPLSSVVLNSLGSAKGVVLKNGAQWFTDGADIVADDGPSNAGTFSSLIEIEAGSRAHLKGMIMDMQSEASQVFSVGGALVLDDVIVSLSQGAGAGVLLTGEGALTMTGDSLIGADGGLTSKPDKGVQATGGRFVGGDSATINAHDNCWEGTIFTTSAATSAASSSAYATANQSDWACASGLPTDEI